jgi:lincosamide nucleotidyltransferase A/C/D/E
VAETGERQAVRVCTALADARVRFWLAGGWGVDALVGRQTRPHRDLDLLVDARDEALTLSVLADLGYLLETDWRPVRVELVRPGSGWVDVHPVVFDTEGNGVQAGPDDTEYRYPADIFTTGRLGGVVVGCVTTTAQRTAHEGYAPRPQDLHDLAQLDLLDAVDHGQA